MAESRRQKVQRLIDQHVRDRNMDQHSIDDHYSMTHVGVEIDPDFFEVRLKMGWGFFKDEPRHLDHITRNMAISVFLAFRGRPGCYHQGKKAVMMGATYEQMMEAFEAGHVAGGGPVLMNGITAVKRMMDEGVVPGQQQSQWTGYWTELGDSEALSSTPANRQASLEERIHTYYTDEHHGSETAKDLIFGARMDPEFFDGFVRLAWEVYSTKLSYLDPIRREMMAMLIVAFQSREEQLEFHIRRALAMGAAYEHLLELFEASFVGAGSAPLFNALRVLRRIHEDDPDQAGSS